MPLMTYCSGKQHRRMGKVMAAIEMVRLPWPEFKLFGDQKSHFSKARCCATMVQF